MAQIETAHANFSLRAAAFVDRSNFLFIERASLDAADLAFYPPLLEFLFPNSPEETLIIYHAYIRKFAHFFIYAVLAFWSWRALKESSRAFLNEYKYLFSLALVTLVAAIDETNQSFNAARTGSIYDVALDFAGGSAVIIITYLLTRNKNTDKIV